MTPEALEALKASIRKWDKNAEAKTPNEYTCGISACPLCAEFYGPPLDGVNFCEGCPVEGKTGKPFCEGSPYESAKNAYWTWDKGGASKPAIDAARAEAAFLRSLLPKGETA